MVAIVDQTFSSFINSKMQLQVSRNAKNSITENHKIIHIQCAEMMKTSLLTQFIEATDHVNI